MTTETAEEMMALISLDRGHRPAAALAATPPPVVSMQGTSPKTASAWTSELLREFIALAGANTRELMATGINSAGLSTQEFCSRLAAPVTGIGKRIAKMTSELREYSPGLPLPVSLQGPPGRKVVRVDPSFTVAYREAAIR